MLLITVQNVKETGICRLEKMFRSEHGSFEAKMLYEDRAPPTAQSICQVVVSQ